MKMQEKITTFVKKHKKPIIITSAVVGGVAVVAVVKKNGRIVIKLPMETVEKIAKEALSSPDIYTGEHAILSASVWNDMMNGIERVITVEGHEILLKHIVNAVEDNL